MRGSGILTIRVENVLTYTAVFSCISLIANDIAKLRLRLVRQDDDGIWVETESSAFSPVLRRPNRYQNRIQFIAQWVTSKLVHGNTYVLKQRDQRGIVTALYILHPLRVTVLVADDGSIYYELSRDNLSGLQDERLVVPAKEVIHDVNFAPYHPLCGISPIHSLRPRGHAGPRDPALVNALLRAGRQACRRPDRTWPHQRSNRHAAQGVLGG